MKSKVLFVLALAVVLLASCSITQELFRGKLPDLNKSFVSEVVISYGNGETNGESDVKATVTRYGTGLWNMVISEPSTLAGMTINYNGEGVTTTMGELEFFIPIEQVEPNAVFAALFRAYDAAATSDEMNYSKSDDGVIFSGQAGDLSYSLTFDSERQTLKSISVPEMGIEVKIMNIMMM